MEFSIAKSKTSDNLKKIVDINLFYCIKQSLFETLLTLFG